MHCELEAVIGSGGRTGKQQTYALLDERIPARGHRFDRDGALAELVRRYLTSHGPATVKDMSWWSGLTMTDIRSALEMLGDEAGSEELDGLSFWSLTSERGRRPPAARGAHLLQTYDELVVGYTESRFHGETAAELARVAWSNPTFPSGIVLLHGRVIGHWRRTIEQKRILAVIHLYDDVTEADRRVLERAVTRLGRFSGLPAAVEVARFRTA